MLSIKVPYLKMLLLIFGSFGSLVCPAQGDDFTFGLKSWSSSMSAPNLEGGSSLFIGAYLSWHLNETIWVSAGYLEGETDFLVSGGLTEGSVQEIDWDFVMGWSLPEIDLDIGVGYRFAEFETVLNDVALPVQSNGPMVYLGGAALFEESPWGYYWGAAYMFEDLEEDDGSQEHLNAEAGVFWTSKASFSVLVGYRYKEYSGDGISGVSFEGISLNLSFSP